MTAFVASASNIRISNTNFVNTATNITCTPAQSFPYTNSPVTNIKKYDVAYKFKINNRTPSINIVFNGAKNVSFCHISHHNLSVEGTCRIVLYGNNDFTNVVYDTGDIKVDPPIALGSYGYKWGVYPLGYSKFYSWNSKFFTSYFPIIGCKSLKIFLTESVGNFDTYIETATIFIGNYISPYSNMEYGLSKQWANRNKYVEKDGGGVITHVTPKYRILNINLKAINFATIDEVQTMTSMLSSIGDTPCFVDCFPLETSIINREYQGIFLNTQGDTLTHSEYGIYTTSVSLREVLNYSFFQEDF